MLEIKGLTKIYGENVVLKDVDLSINEGEIVCLLGGSGVGKSTLMRCLANLEEKDGGEITLSGDSLELDGKDKGRVGMVFQGFNLFDHLTVLDNITLPLIKAFGKSKEEATKIALELLEDFSLKDKAPMYPSSLSGGQKQRVAIVRSLAVNPAVICLDEPTSALDPSLTKVVVETIEGLAKKGLCILVTTHDVSFIRAIKGRICLMKSGQIVETGLVENYLENPASLPLISEYMDSH